MKKFALVLATLIPALSTFAQVEAEIVVNQDKFLPAEELSAGVRIVNRSGQTLHLGEDADWVKFTIEKESGGVVHQTAEPPVKGGFDLKSTERATMRVDLAPCYNLRQQGRYLISATVKIKEWNQTISTKPVAVEIVEGTKLWEQTVGVPQPGGPPEMRSYTLQQANYLKDQLRLYLRVADRHGHVLKMINVGPMISFGQPEQQIDSTSRLHLLYQKSNKRFAYLVVKPDGEIQTRQTFEYTETRPRLQPDDKVGISVSGGERIVSADDIPRVKKSKDDDKKDTQ
jgi:hypothetical protein